MKWTLALLLLLGGCAPVRSALREDPEPSGRQPRPEALAARMLLAAGPADTPVQYDRFCDANGNITVDAEVIAMLGRPGELDAIYEDALRGGVRATRFLRGLELTSEASARKMAEYVSSPECAVLPVLRRCQPTWTLLAPLEGQGRGAERLRQVTQDAYEQRLRELVPQRALNRAALDMLMAMGPVGKVATTLENEARAGARLARDRSAGALERQQGSAKVAVTSAAGLEALEKSSGLSREALAAKLAEAEAAEVGPRLSAELGALEKLRPSVEKPPAGVPEGTLWREYVGYWETRFSELGRARAAAPAAVDARVKPPLTWFAYQELRSAFARGIEFQRTMTAQLRADAALPMEQRTLLRDFRSPRVEQNVGVTKGDGLRFADQLVIETEPARGQLPRVEAWSCKSRDMRGLSAEDLKARVNADVAEARQKYGGALEIRRASFGPGERSVNVRQVHLVYDAEFRLEKTALDALQEVLDPAKRAGVSISFR